MARLRGAGEAIAEMADDAGLPAGAREPGPADEPLLPLGDATAITLELAASPNDRTGAVQRARGRGRPKGSRNRRSEQLVQFILSQYSHPLITLAQTYSRPVEVLAAELQCSRADAFALQMRAASELAPYIESKKPVAVQVDSRTISLTIHQGAPGDAAGDAAGVDLVMMPAGGAADQGADGADQGAAGAVDGVADGAPGENQESEQNQEDGAA